MYGKFESEHESVTSKREHAPHTQDQTCMQERGRPGGFYSTMENRSVLFLSAAPKLTLRHNTLDTTARSFTARLPTKNFTTRQLMVACGINAPTVTLRARGMASGTRAAQPAHLPTQPLLREAAFDSRRRYRVVYPTIL